MKTLHLTNAWHSTSGGIATFYRALMDAANQRGHEMRLVVPAREDHIEHVGPHARIYYLASPAAPLNSDYRIVLPRKYLLRGARLRQIVEQERPDLVEICDKYTLNYFGGMLRVGIVKDVHCRPLVVGLSCERMDDNVRVYIGWNGLGQKLVKFYMKWLYFALFDHHIANSEYTAEELRSASIGHPIRRGVWIRPMGVDFSELSPAHCSSVARHHLLQMVDGGAKAALLLYAGRLVPEKNLGLLIDTLAALQDKKDRDWRLLIVGDGVSRKSFLAEADQRVHGHVFWMGHIQDRTELARIYANCDVFVHPNPREPFGIAPLEAMSSGLPLVAPNCGGITAYANPGNAWLAPPTADAFADAIGAAVCESPDRDLRLENAIATAAQFRWDKVAGAFLDLYENLAGAPGSAAHRFPANFFSTAPPGNGVPMARITSGILQRLLTLR